MPSSDYPSLFEPPRPGEPFRQGEILTFNPSDGSNTVRVGGSVLADLPVLVGGDTVNFAPGDAVILLKYQSSWAILGRIVVPGGSELTATAVDFFANTVFNVTPTTINGTAQTLASQALAPPAWANSVVVMAITHGIFANNSGVSDSVRIMTDLSTGEFGGESIHQVINGDFKTVTTPFAFTKTQTPLPAITIRSRVRTNGGSWNLGARAVYLNTIAIYRRA